MKPRRLLIPLRLAMVSFLLGACGGGSGGDSGGGGSNGSASCHVIQPEVASHVAAMSTTGWRAINRANLLSMFGCAGAPNTLACLDTFPSSSANPWSQNWTADAPGTALRILREITTATSFWTRSSPDGRFVAHGKGEGSPKSTIIDLQRAVAIPAMALYEPGFLPDNSGFFFQGGTKSMCSNSLLDAAPSSVNFNEVECSNLTLGLGQHFGAVPGQDYWGVSSHFIDDDGTAEPAFSFGGTASVKLTPINFNGTGYTQKNQINVPTPDEGDAVLSPSAILMATRSALAVHSVGFTVRKINAVPSGMTYNVTPSIIANYCVQGGRPTFSYDERWLAFHHWVQAADWKDLGFASAGDPAFLALVAQASNVYLLDVLTGKSHRVTRTAPGQRALFPHFRSDGWLYFIVKDINRNTEVLVASDAALVYE